MHVQVSQVQLWSSDCGVCEGTGARGGGAPGAGYRGTGLLAAEMAVAKSCFGMERLVEDISVSVDAGCLLR